MSRKEARIKAKLQRIRDHRYKMEQRKASSVTMIGNKKAVFTNRKQEGGGNNVETR